MRVTGVNWHGQGVYDDIGQDTCPLFFPQRAKIRGRQHHQSWVSFVLPVACLPERPCTGRDRESTCRVCPCQNDGIHQEASPQGRLSIRADCQRVLSLQTTIVGYLRSCLKFFSKVLCDIIPACFRRFNRKIALLFSSKNDENLHKSLSQIFWEKILNSFLYRQVFGHQSGDYQVTPDYKLNL